MGNTANMFQRYIRISEPFKRDDKYYIEVEHPTTKKLKEVRWYPNKPSIQIAGLPALPKVFGFESTKDCIVIIKQIHITPDEEADYFKNKWRYSRFFGGNWYSPQGTELPPIRQKDNYKFIDWADWQAEGQRESTKLNLVEQGKSAWFREYK